METVEDNLLVYYSPRSAAARLN